MIKIIKIKVIMLVSIFLFLSFGVNASDEILYYQPGPQGLVGISKPTITWTFDSLGENEITDVEILINGESYYGYYNKNAKKIQFTPDEPLDVGEHNVTIVITINDNQKIKNSFKFTIDENPLEEINVTETIDEVKETINKYREIVGIGKVEFNKNLNLAAKAHSKYMLENNVAEIYEYNKKSDFFTGEEPIDRAKYFNYQNPIVVENINFTKSHQKAVRNWMDSVYQRLPLINPNFTEIGYGYDTNGNKHINVLDLGTTFNEVQDIIITYPANGQDAIPITWENIDENSPLRLFKNVKEPTGYPITLSVFGKGVTGVIINDARITLDNKEVSSYVVVPKISGHNIPSSLYLKTDENLKKDIALIPINKLEKNKTYNVFVSGKILYSDKREKEFVKEWNFTTGNGNFRFDTDSNKKQINIYIDNDEIFFEKKPYIVNGTTYIPVREFIEKIGGNVTWINEDRSVLVKFRDKEIALKIDNGVINVLDDNKSIESNIILQKGSTFVPIRDIIGILGFDILWDGDYMDIYITIESDENKN